MHSTCVHCKHNIHNTRGEYSSFGDYYRCTELLYVFCTFVVGCVHKRKGINNDWFKAPYDKLLLVLSNYFLLKLKWYGGTFDDEFTENKLMNQKYWKNSNWFNTKFSHVYGKFFLQNGDYFVRWLAYVSTVLLITHSYQMMWRSTHKELNYIINEIKWL